MKSYLAVYDILAVIPKRGPLSKMLSLSKFKEFEEKDIERYNDYVLANPGTGELAVQPEKVSLGYCLPLQWQKHGAVCQITVQVLAKSAKAGMKLAEKFINEEYPKLECDASVYPRLA